MKKKGYSTYRSITAIGTLLLIILLTAMACTKPPVDEPVGPYIDPVPPLSAPTGVIDTFYITDTLVPFYTSGSYLKWSVSGTNTQTVVTINGLKLGFSGILETGPLKQTTAFTLMINNGKAATRTLKVADSVTTNMWNKGKRLKITQIERYITPRNAAIPRWVADSVIDAHVLDQRIYFSYFGNSEVYQKTSNQQVALADGGRFVVHILNPAIPGDETYFIWQGLKYTITKLDANSLVVIYDEPQANGTKLSTRNTYQFE